MASVTSIRPNGQKSPLEVAMRKPRDWQDARELFSQGRITPGDYAAARDAEMARLERVAAEATARAASAEAAAQRAKRSAAPVGNKPAVDLSKEGKLSLTGSTRESCTLTQYLRRVLAVGDVLAIARSLIGQVATVEIVTKTTSDGKPVIDKKTSQPVTYERCLVGGVLVGWGQKDADALPSLIAEVSALLASEVEGGAA